MMAASDGADLVYDEDGNVMFARHRTEHTKRSARAKAAQSVPAEELDDLARQLVGLTADRATELVAEFGHGITLELVGASQPIAPMFRFNHVKAFIRDGLVVDATLG